MRNQLPIGIGLGFPKVSWAIFRVSIFGQAYDGQKAA